MGYQAFVFLPADTDVTIEQVRQTLEEFYSDDEGEVVFQINDSVLDMTIDEWEVRIALNRASTVAVEAREMANLFAADRSDQAEIAASAVRLEILTEDDNEDLEFFNDYLLITEQLAEFRGAKVWDAQQEEFVD